MYADRVACCPLVSHGKYADGTVRQTDERQTVTLRFPPNAASVTRGRRSQQRIPFQWRMLKIKLNSQLTGSHNDVFGIWEKKPTYREGAHPHLRTFKKL